VRAGTLVGDHRRCLPAAAAACARGLCVPAFLASQWLAQLRGAGEVDPEGSIRAFVAEELARLSGVIGDDPLRLWRAAWQARHGTQARAAPPILSGRGDASRDAMARTLARRAARRAALGDPP
jgi:hypothetical protein